MFRRNLIASVLLNLLIESFRFSLCRLRSEAVPLRVDGICVAVQAVAFRFRC